MLTVTSLLKESLKLYRSHATNYIGYVAWLLLPFSGMVLLSLLPQTFFVFVLGIFLTFVQIFLAVWLAILLIQLTTSFKAGEKPDGIKFQKHATLLLRSALIIIALQLLVEIGGIILLVIPGLIFAVWYGFSVFTLIFENKKSINALSASRELSRGRFWPVCWRYYAGPILMLIVYSLILAILVTTISAIIGIDPQEALQIGTIPPLWVSILDAIAEILLFPLVMIYLTLLYQELKKDHCKSPECEIVNEGVGYEA